MAALLPVSCFDNPGGGFAQRADFEIGAIGPALTIPMVDEDGPAAGAVTGLHVAPAIADDVAGRQVNIPIARGIQQQARARLAASAARGIVVRTNADVVQIQVTLQAAVDFSHLRGAGGAS